MATYIRIFVLALFVITVLSGCDKVERASRKLVHTGRWEMTEMSAGNTTFTKLPKWQFYDCADAENFCEATWEHQNGSAIKFYWKFSNLGGDFEFFADPEESDSGTMAYSQCDNFSGIYDVRKNTSKVLWLESDESKGYPGKFVTLKLIRDLN